MTNDVVTRDKIDSYLAKTRAALAKAKVAPPEPSHHHDLALDFRKMAESYFADAEHFAAKGELVLAFAAVNYAHAWLDAGARLGLFDVGRDDDLFTLSR
ncbi:MAG: DUF357 domain-containing protein [Thermoplasmatota archaeon]